jgi:Flp pilus assembly protein TadB
MSPFRPDERRSGSDLPRFLENEEVVMARSSDTVREHPFKFLVTGVGMGLIAWWAVALSNLLVWATVAVIACATIALYVWRLRVDAARERAWVGAFSFGDVLARRRAREALQA